jgi:hypothetical protein
MMFGGRVGTERNPCTIFLAVDAGDTSREPLVACRLCEADEGDWWQDPH